MDIEQRSQIAENNLSRKLDWVGRYDTRIAFIAGVSIAMLGVLANACANITCWNWILIITFGLASLFLLISLIFIYFGQHPKTLSPNTSLIFFGTIAKMSYSDFKTKFIAATSDEYFEDLLCQTHINSEILQEKFRNLKNALTMIALSVLPWTISIYLSKIFIK